MKTPHHSVSGRSYLASTPDSSNVAVFEVRLYLLGFLFYLFFSILIMLQFLTARLSLCIFMTQGDWVWLKKCPAGCVSNVSSSTENIFVKVGSPLHMKHFNKIC